MAGVDPPFVLQVLNNQAEGWWSGLLHLTRNQNVLLGLCWTPLEINDLARLLPTAKMTHSVYFGPLFKRGGVQWKGT